MHWFIIFAICGPNPAAAPWEKSWDAYRELEVGPILVKGRGILNVVGTHSAGHVVKRWNLPDDHGEERAGSVLVYVHGMLHGTGIHFVGHEAGAWYSPVWGARHPSSRWARS